MYMQDVTHGLAFTSIANTLSTCMQYKNKKPAMLYTYTGKSRIESRNLIHVENMMVMETASCNRIKDENQNRVTMHYLVYVLS